MAENVRGRLIRVIETFDPAAQKFINRALALAENVHAGQFRRPKPDHPDHRDPYIIHPMRVALILWEEAGQQKSDLIAAALLHDVVEDSDGRVTADNIGQQFDG